MTDNNFMMVKVTVWGERFARTGGENLEKKQLLIMGPM